MMYIEPGTWRTDEAEILRLRELKIEKILAEKPVANFGLDELVGKVEELLGLTQTGTDASDDDTSRAFSDDVFSVELSRPDNPELTLVDLPGVSYSKDKEVSVVNDLAERYIKDTRSIILLVIAAGSDCHAEQLLDTVKRFDPEFGRTLGIVTHLDTLEPNSEETKFLQLITNNKTRLPLGWHALRNRSFETRDVPDNTRDEMEKAFFSTGRWSSVSREYVGADSLTYRLTGILLDHTKRQLSNLVPEVNSKIADCQTRLAKLGDARSTLQQQRGYLLSVSGSFERINRQALNGLYTDDFFGGLDTASSSSFPDPRRLRAVIRDLNEMFTQNMHRKGCRRLVYDPDCPLRVPWHCSRVIRMLT